MNAQCTPCPRRLRHAQGDFLHAQGDFLHAQGGFTLVELMTAVGLLSLLLLSVTTLYIGMMRVAASTTSAAFVSLDAAGAVQRVSNNLREAQNVEMMDGTGTVDGAVFGTVYDVMNNGTVLGVTGIRVFTPGVFVSTGTPPTGVPAGTVAVSITGHASPTALSGINAPWDHNVQGASVDIFRASWKQGGLADGTPRPADGNCLWIRGTEQGRVVDRPIVTSIAPNTDAVQFIQPLSNPSDTSSARIANAIEVKITCARFDPVHGVTSSDSASGGVSTLTGQSVYLRDHTPLGAAVSGTNAYAPF